MWALLFNTARRNGHKPEFLLAEQNFPVPLLLSVETTRRLCRRVVSEVLPAIFSYKKTYISRYTKHI